MREVCLVVPICHVSGCDCGATASVGITPLCKLHESSILAMLDAGWAARQGEPAFP
ncbi:MAG: hypothetical protein ABIZ69_11865 [Ilumatobacteraceae bacterium]